MNYKEFFKKASMIYSSLQDEQSRFIWINRLAWEVTKKDEYLDAILDFHLNDFKVKVGRLDTDRAIIYGAGAVCETVIRICESNNISVICICDNNPQKQMDGFKGFEVISPEEMIQRYPHETVIVSTLKHRDEVIDILDPIYGDRLVAFDDAVVKYQEEQYLERSIVEINDREIFVDAGAYDFENALSFIKKSSMGMVYSFEADHRNINRFRSRIPSEYKDAIRIMPYGLWSKTGELNFVDEGSVGSRISDDETGTRINVVSLDEAIKKATFIKMDIEGAELEALKGSRSIIEQCHPKLAICIYHKPEDLIEIPCFIREIHPDYKLFVRHYSCTSAETVLYAI